MKGVRVWTAAGCLLLASLGVSVRAHSQEAREYVQPHVQSPQARPVAGSPALTLAALDRRLADLDNEEQSGKRELAEMGQKLADAKNRAIVRGRTFYKLTRAGLLPVGGGFDELVRHALRVERSRRSLGDDLATERMLRERSVELSRHLERIGIDRAALLAQRHQLDAARRDTEDDMRRQDSFDRAFKSSSGSGYVAVYGGAPSIDDQSGGSFRAAKGKLLFPLSGRAEAHPSRREGLENQALEIRTSLHAPVRAVFAGRVAFADRYGPYGKLVIVDHGDHYYTVSGNLADIDVKIGQDVAPGERLGSVGDDGKGPALYFEVRRGTQAIAAAPWLGL